MQASFGRARQPASIAFALALAACAGSGSGLPSAGTQAPIEAYQANVRPRISGKIQHVVIIIQENRSVDNLFQGLPGADTQSYGYTSKGKKVKLIPRSLADEWDIDHSARSYFQACDGQGSFPGTHCKMDGFNRESLECQGLGPGHCPAGNPQYGYVPHSESKPYFDMAQQYVFGDRMFTSEFDASSFVSHQYIIAGQANSTVDYPTNLWGCDGGKTDVVNTIDQQRVITNNYIPVCMDSQTLGDELDAAKLSWGYYTAGVYGDGNIWNAYQAIKHIRYGPDWKADVIRPQTRFLKDVANGQLRTVSWVTPTCENSDHAGCGSSTGPSWVTSLVNAVGESTYWDSTAIFVFWDEYGGWYDHVPPKKVDYDGLGIRVPLLIVSPYAKKGYVSHVQYEHGSILRFVEDQFGLGRLAASDSRATSPEADCFDFKQKPRAFVPISAPHDESYFLTQALDPRAVDNE
ncbi:MAG TPA: alkaline phosphatase family protein [Candidatus Tumulicola sp.]|jgi:phospholipase C